MYTGGTIQQWFITTFCGTLPFINQCFVGAVLTMIETAGARTPTLSWSWCFTLHRGYPLVNQHSYRKSHFLVGKTSKWWWISYSYVSLLEGMIPLQSLKLKFYQTRLKWNKHLHKYVPLMCQSHFQLSICTLKMETSFLAKTFGQQLILLLLGCYNSTNSRSGK